MEETMKKELQTAFHPRQYMLSEDFEIYYYNDKPVYKVNSHIHDYYEFYFFLEGNVSIIIDKQPHALKPGDVILIPPNVPHFVTIHDKTIPYRRFVFWISKAFWQELETLSRDYTFLMKHTAATGEYIFHYDVIAFNGLQSKVFALIEELQFERFGKAIRVSLCVHDLILHLNRSVYESIHVAAPGREQSLYVSLLEYIERHLDEDLSLDRLSQEFFVSKYHIAHIFKEHIGMSIHQYIMKKRLAMCRNAILSHVSISEAYVQCGFQDYSSFYRAFKKEYGMSPKEFAELHVPVTPLS